MSYGPIEGGIVFLDLKEKSLFSFGYYLSKKVKLNISIFYAKRRQIKNPLILLGTFDQEKDGNEKLGVVFTTPIVPLKP